jgi:tetratricopeptide (TPR) repeat protein
LKAVALIPDDPVILEHLGDIYLKMNQPKKALDYYQKALSVKEDDQDGLKKKIQSLKQRK